MVDIEGVSEADARSWEAQLSRYYFACGCEVASVVLLVALAGYLVAISQGPGGLSASTWHDAVRGALVGFAATVAGKVLGLVHARRRLRATVHSIAARLAKLEARPSLAS